MTTKGPSSDTLQLRRGTAAEWTSSDPVLSAGEVGWERNTNKVKIGDGATAWTSLPYLAGTGVGADHGLLTGLGDDDHPQYAALAQDESITGFWSFTDGVEENSGTGFQSRHSTEAGVAFGAYVDGDPIYRWYVQQDGKIQWGPGSDAVDTNLYRKSANILATDDRFDALTIITLSDKSTDSAIQNYDDADTEPSFRWQGDGKILIGAGGSTAPDTNLYRSAANVLKTDDSFIAVESVTGLGTVGGVGIVAQTTQASGSAFQVSGAAGSRLWALIPAGTGTGLESGAGGLSIYDGSAGSERLAFNTSGDVNIVNDTGQLLFGGAQDTNLYRSAANVLKTDDYFQSGSYITAFVGDPDHEVLMGSVVAGYAGINFAVDTSIYRLSSGNLQTQAVFSTTAAAMRILNAGATLYFGAANELYIDKQAWDVGGYDILATNKDFWLDGNIGLVAGNHYYLVAQSNSTTMQVGSAAGWTTGINFSTPYESDTKMRLSGSDNLLEFKGTVSLGWTNGAVGATVDTNLYRSAANILKTDDAFVSTLGITPGSNASDVAITFPAAKAVRTAGNVTGQQAYFDLGTSNFRDGDGSGGGGIINVGLMIRTDTYNNLGSAAGITWGTANDTNLYRAAAAVLHTNSQLIADGGFQLASGTSVSSSGFFILQTGAANDQLILAQSGGEAMRMNTAGDWNLAPTKKVVWGASVGAEDTNLYRSAANVLKTDDTLNVAVDVQVGTFGMLLSGAGTRLEAQFWTYLGNTGPYIQLDNSAVNVINRDAITNRPLRVRGMAGQTGALQSWEDSTPTVLASVTPTGAFDFLEQAAPAAPAANTGRVFFQDDGSGKTQAAIRFPSGASQIIATEP